MGKPHRIGKSLDENMRLRSDVDQSRFGNSLLPFASFVFLMETLDTDTSGETFGNDPSRFEALLGEFLYK